MTQRGKSLHAPEPLTLASWLCIFPGFYAVIAPFVQLLPSHAFDMTWSAHARFHLTWAASKLFAIGVNQILLAVFPLRSGQRWSWFALLSNLLFGGVVIIPASRFQQTRAARFPLHKHDLATKLAALSMLSTILGLGLAFRPLFGGKARRLKEIQED